MRRLARYAGLVLWASFWLGAPVASFDALAQGTEVQPGTADSRIEPPRPHPGDVMRHWPAYPEDALAAGQEGTVIVALRVTATGEPEDISVQRSSSVTSLDIAAVAAVSRWRFDPGKRDGVAVDMKVSLPIRFSLPEEMPASEQK
ncbi:energy transducer TonB [Pseudochelatococcus sp. B33]